MRAPIVVPTQAGYPKGPEPARSKEHQGHPEGITTLATAIVPFSGRVIPTAVILSLVPLHLGVDQYLPSINPSLQPPLHQGGGLSPFPSSHLSEPSQSPMGCPVAAGDVTMDPQYLEYAPTPSGLSITPRHDGPTQGLILGASPVAATASPGVTVAVYPPSFNQASGTYLISDHSPSSSLVNRDVVPPANTTNQNEGNGQSTSRRLGQTYKDTPPLFNTAGPIRGVGVNQHPSRHQCTVCDASYARLSGLSRHYKDKHMAWMACRRCNTKFSLGRMYQFTEHLQTCPGA